MATVNSFKVKNVSSIDLPIQISSNRVIDDYTEIGTTYAAIRQLDRNIGVVQQNLNKEITDLHTDYLAWERQHDGTVLRASLNSGSTTSTRSLVIGENNHIDTGVSNSLVLGIGNTAKASNSLILGKYADTQNSTLFAIGEGTERQPGNILEVYKQPLTDQISRSVIELSGYLLPPTNDVYSIGDETKSFSSVWSERAYAKKGFVKKFGIANYYAPMMQVVYDFPDGSYLDQSTSTLVLEQGDMVIDTFSSEVWFALEYEYVFPTELDGIGNQDWCCRAFTTPFCPWNFTTVSGRGAQRIIEFPIQGPSGVDHLSIARDSYDEDNKILGDFSFTLRGSQQSRLELLRLWCIRMPDLTYNHAYDWEDPLE